MKQLFLFNISCLFFSKLVRHFYICNFLTCSLTTNNNIPTFSKYTQAKMILGFKMSQRDKMLVDKVLWLFSKFRRNGISLLYFVSFLRNFACLALYFLPILNPDGILKSENYFYLCLLNITAANSRNTTEQYSTG